MNTFSISQMARFSGIKPHTIRMWEQRYNALKPDRSDGNTRYYDGLQLRRLLNIVGLMASGHKISELASLRDPLLHELLREKQQKKEGISSNYFISQLIAAGMTYNEQAFDKIFSHCLLRFGLKKTYVEIICPMLNQIGLLWATNDLPPANEHFISNIVRQKLYVSIDSLPPSTQAHNTWVLFLPENEFHEIGLLMANYLIRSAGNNTIYLGPNVPISSVLKAAEDIKPQKILLFFSHKDVPSDVGAYLRDIIETTGKKVYVAAPKNLLETIADEKMIVKLHSIKELEAQF